MATFILFLAFLFGGSALLFDNAAYLAFYGFPWVRDACYAVSLFYERSELGMYASVGLAGIWAVLKTASILRN